MKCTSDISPEKLNDIEVRRLSCPLQNLHFFVLLLCPVNGWFGLVFWIIVTLEGPSASCVCRLMSANCHQFLWISLCFCSSYIPKTLKIYLHVQVVHFSHRLCGLPSKYSIYGFDHKFHFWSHHFKWLTFDLLLTKWHTILWPWLSNGFFLFCASASLLWILNLSCHFLAVKPVFQLK